MKPTVAIIGVGLIGGSLGMALRRSGKYRVVGIGRDAKRLRKAKQLGAVDEFTTRLSDVISADVVVIGSPVDTVAPMFERIVPFLKPGAIVTDVGSVKGPIMDAVKRVERPASIHFVGGHPLAGSHKTGVEAASSRLFAGSTVVLVSAASKPLRALKTLWNAAGANVQVMTAEQHDRAVALISHLPHAIAHALVHAFASRADRRRIAPLLAGSFRDGTRVASSDPEQWAQILRANAAAIREALKFFRFELDRIDDQLTRPHLAKHLRRSHAVRRPLFHGK
jgi:prephenate dehydrogenase